MRDIINEWNSFINEGGVDKYRFETAIRIITDEAMEKIKSNIGKSMSRFDFAEFSFKGGLSDSGKKLPDEILPLVKNIYGRIRFVDSISEPSDSSVQGTYQHSKKTIGVNITLPSNFTLQDIRPSGINAKIKSNLRHEFEHTLDDIRGIKRLARGIGSGTLQDYKMYFTSPHEVNAYTVGFKRKAKSLGQSWESVKDSFMNWLHQNLLSKVNAEKSWDRIRLAPGQDEYATEADIEALINDISTALSKRYTEKYGIKIDVGS
jgi:hypothetical protein